MLLINVKKIMAHPNCFQYVSLREINYSDIVVLFISHITLIYYTHVVLYKLFCVYSMFYSKVSHMCSTLTCFMSIPTFTLMYHTHVVLYELFVCIIHLLF